MRSDLDPGKLVLVILNTHTPLSECPACESLWRSYRDAMIAHLLVGDELEMARLVNSSARSMDLEDVQFREEKRRDEAHLAAVNHQRSHATRLAA